MVTLAPPPGYLRGSKYGWTFAAIWLGYLWDNLTHLWQQPNQLAKIVGLIALAGFAALYLYLVHLSRWVRYNQQRPDRFLAQASAGLIAMFLLAVLQVPGAGQPSLSCLVYIAAFAMIALPLQVALPLDVLLFVLAEVLPATVPGWKGTGYGLAVLLGSLATWGIRLAAERQSRLVRAQEELATLAVQNERTRIAADLHDILGHSLTVVTIKAELAQRLLDVDLDKARKELQDLEALARDALTDVRATALGVRGISLPGEIAAARQALAAANVTAVLPGAADEVPSRWRELFAWTIREAVTNVVRHARATHVEVRLSPASVEIIDDGVGAAMPAGGGQGLVGLRRRADAVGAQLTVGWREDRSGFRVHLQVPS